MSGNNSAGNGGGIYAYASVSLIDSTVSGNTATGNGGGIYGFLSTVSVENSTVNGNTASAAGGGIFGLASSVSLTNSTLSGNSATQDGGGISVLLEGFDLEITSSTVTGNVSSQVGGGIKIETFNYGPYVSSVAIRNSILTGNSDNGTAPNLFLTNYEGPPTLPIIEHSLVGDTAGSGIDANSGQGNILNQPALLAALADNGGPTLTHALLAGSPAIDAGDNALAGGLLTDQRGEARVQFGTVDIGAVESGSEVLPQTMVTVNTSADFTSPTADTSSITALIANDGGDGISLREAIAAANNTMGENEIAFDASVFTGGDNSVIRLTQGTLVIGDTLNIDGTSVGGVLITGDANDDDATIGGTHITDVAASFGHSVGAADDLLDDNSQVLHFSDTTGNLTLAGLTITGGRNTVGGAVGGGIRFDSSGTISLDQTIVSGNSNVDSSGGGIYTNSGSVSLLNSTVSQNSSGNRGGGIGTSSGDVSLLNSTVSGNSASFFGGGIRTLSGSISLTNSTLDSNSAGNGGGLNILSGDVSLTNSTVSGNSSLGSGGGIRVSTSSGVSLVSSTVTGNLASGPGGGIFLVCLLYTSPSPRD